MAQDLINKFKKVNHLYGKMVSVSKEAFEQLKKENRPTVEELNQDLLLLNFDLKKELSDLTTMIEQKCEEKKVDTKITNLVQFYSVEEKEKTMAALETAIHYERTLNKNVMMYHLLAEAKKETSETLIDVWRYEAEQAGGTKRFVDRKL